MPQPATLNQRLYFPSEGRRRGFFRPKNPTPGLNPRTWVPEASALTTSKPLNSGLTAGGEARQRTQNCRSKGNGCLFVCCWSRSERAVSSTQGCLSQKREAHFKWHRPLIELRRRTANWASSINMQTSLKLRMKKVKNVIRIWSQYRASKMSVETWKHSLEKTLETKAGLEGEL
jgi:hypothetical protein